MDPVRSETTTGYKTRGQRPGHPDSHPLTPELPSSNAAAALAEERTSFSTLSRHGDIAAELRLVMNDRHEAWQAGVLEGFAHGWEQGLAAGLERAVA